jgi:F-type H+-transporting ATPase subunit b
LVAVALTLALAVAPGRVLAEEHGAPPAEAEPGHEAAGAHGEHGDAHGDPGAHGGHAVHLDNWFSFDYGKPDSKYRNGPLLFAIINFAILVWLLVRFTRKPISEYLENRHATIRRDLEQAAELRQQAQRKLQDIEAKIESIDAEIAQIKADVAKDAEQEKLRIIQTAEAEADRIIKSADQTMEREIQRARKKLEGEAVETALRLAEELIRDKINLADRRKMNERYIQQLTASGDSN